MTSITAFSLSSSRMKAFDCKATTSNSRRTAKLWARPTKRSKRNPPPAEEEGGEISSAIEESPTLKPVKVLTKGIMRQDEEDDEQEWLSDRELLRRAAQTPGGEALTNRDRNTLKKFTYAPTAEDSSSYYALPDSTAKKSVYTDEEKELIRSMDSSRDADNFLSSREEGYLGDSSLIDIARDYAVPVCYIADVLVTWGVQPPISIDSILGDLVTGEQAFALIEALTTLDNTQLNERYSYNDLLTISEDYDLDLKQIFQFCIQENYNLPFGVRTCLRVEQEKELLRVLLEDEYYDTDR